MNTDSLKKKPLPNTAKAQMIAKRQRGARFHKKNFDNQNKVNGVLYYLHDRGVYKLENQHKIIIHYSTSILKLDYKKKSLKNKIILSCKKIQEDFKKFTDWYISLENIVKEESN